MPKNPTLHLSSVKPPDTRKVRGLRAFKVRSGAWPQARGSRRERLEHAPGSKCVVICVLPRWRAFVLSQNVRRRHLTASQRAAVAADFLPALEAEAKARMAAAGAKAAPARPATKPAPAGAPLPKFVERAADRAAQAIGAAPRSVQRAKRVKDADPDLHEQVKSGQVKLSAAEGRVTEAQVTPIIDAAER